MNNREISIGKAYAHAIQNRAVEPLPPLHFEPDWADRPSLYKIYEDVRPLSPTEIVF